MGEKNMNRREMKTAEKLVMEAGGYLEEIGRVSVWMPDKTTSLRRKFFKGVVIKGIDGLSVATMCVNLKEVRSRLESARIEAKNEAEYRKVCARLGIN
jgi:hypothetical protein